MATETRRPSAADWSRVRAAIVYRWPQLDPTELERCDNDVGELIEFVRQRVDAGDGEIAAVVKELAPVERTIYQGVIRTSTRRDDDAGRLFQAGYRSVQSQIAERPGQSLLAIFVIGTLFGATVSALWFQPPTGSTVRGGLRNRPWR